MSSHETHTTSLYPEVDEATLAQLVEALESGDTTRLAPARAAEIEEARALVRFTPVRVPGADGTELDGALWLHPGDRPRPVVVMPSPWTHLGWLLYVAQATRFALKGYHVLAYTARGFGLSKGNVEVAGPLDVQDGIAALTFVLSRIDGEASGIGFLGDSYGSGISQLVAAHDPRVTAVVALSTWGDLGAAFYENETRHTAAVETLRKAAAEKRLSEDTRTRFDNVRDNEDIEGTLEWARERSPIHHIEAINNRERPLPVLFANAWHETLFPTNQLLTMFNALTGPKRLLLSIGDHSAPEMSGIVGLPNRIWEEAHRWFDHYLLRVDTGVDLEDEVVTEIMWSKALEEQPTWGAVTGRTERLYLSAPQNGGDGTLSDKPGADGEVAFAAGTDTPATVADKIIGTGNAELAGNPKVYPTAEIDRAHAGVWATAPLPVTAKLRGVPRLHLTYTVDAAESTLIAYLFDVDAEDNAHIITHAPFTELRGESGRPVSVDIALQATGYDVRAGHRVMLVIDTIDPFYGDATDGDSTISLTLSDEDPSHLELPLS
ncbi:CocE/NonD family hydrolase [Embleya sp. MST-111070]|uniref:CocE/NonD family hydrolase n=1 Tax=Embleya sp. MST-111070 TaxID=3398231 RepID=UPI003F73D7E2